VENKSTPHNLVVLDIFMPEIINIGKHLTRFWQKIA